MFSSGCIPDITGFFGPLKRFASRLKSCFFGPLKRFASRLKSCSLYSYQFLIFHANPLYIHFSYFIFISILGFLLLKSLDFKQQTDDNKPSNLNLFFTSVSAATVSSMSTVEMEVFSDSQLILLTVLMLIGGEVVTSTAGLYFRKEQIRQRSMAQIKPNSNFQIELSTLDQIESGIVTSPQPQLLTCKVLKHDAVKCLAKVLVGYLVLIHVGGFVSVIAYISIISSAKDVLKKKDLRISTFSMFTVVSSFSSCGFIPTNENMMVFKKNSGLLLLIVPLILVGNTLFPPALRFCIWVLQRLTKKSEYDYLLRNSEKTRYYHLLPRLPSILLVFTVVGFIAIQIILVCCMEWHSQAFAGFSSYQKIINALFLSVNARHTGESTVDLSTLSQAVLVLFIVMMYLPPYTTFIPIEDQKCSSGNATESKKRMGLMKSLVMSQLSYLAISIIVVCITERRKLVEDPLNFNVLNIVLEVISAYGNVGFSTGYSCARQLKSDGHCKDAWYGFVGKWSSKGKIVLIFVMLFGRLKKFSMHSGKAWKLN